ncbi:MAG: hypothetical protein QM698_04940 [Micropepsaceae bacterium]
MRLLFAFLTVFLFAFPAAAAPRKDRPGPEKVGILTGEWIDPARDGRAVPYKIYYPVTASGPRPVVVFSHGLGGSREGGAYLGEHLASWGYVAVHIQHPGSDESVWRDLTGRDEIVKKLAAAARDIDVIRGRFEDVPFALDRLQQMNASGPLAGRIDMTRLGMSGHSFGAVSTLTAAGQALRLAGLRFKEPRFKAAIAYSPNKPQGRADLNEVYDSITIPILHFTGTNDMNPLNPDQPASDRTIPFRHIPAPGQYLVVLDGGDHMVFGGEGAKRRGRDDSNDAAFHRLIAEMSVNFWDAYLMGDAEALAWLRNGAAAEELGAAASYDTRN